MTDLLMVLYEQSKVSLLHPQSVPASRRMALFLDDTFAQVIFECCANDNVGSNVTPNIFGFLSRGIFVLFISMFNS